MGTRRGSAAIALSTGAAVLLMFVALLPAQPTNAATATVLVGQASGGAPAQRFNPASITVAAGDTVSWNWFNGVHDVQAYDGSYSSGATGGINSTGDSFTRAFSVPGTYTYYCNNHASVGDADPAEIDARIAQGKMVGKIVALASDVQGPTVDSLFAAPNPTNGTTLVTLTVTLTDGGSPNSNIQTAEYFVGVAGPNGTGTPMAASDGAFDSVTEQVVASVDVTGWAFIGFDLLVHGQDAAGNWGPTTTTVLSVTDLPIGNETALVTLTAGTLFNSTTPISFPGVTITGLPQAIDTSPAAWRASDGTGAGAGWSVTLTSTDFTSASGVIPAANFMIRLLDSNIITVAGGTPPASQQTTYVALDTTLPLTLLSAAPGTGIGTYNYAPEFRLGISASIAPGDYVASLVVTIGVGP